MKRKIILEGELGEKFGRERFLNVDSFAQLSNCLSANFDDYEDFLLDCDKKGISFLCRVDDTPITDEKELLLNHGKGTLIITPIPAGAGIISSIVKTIAGFALIVVGAAFMLFGGAAGFLVGSLMMIAGNLLFAQGMAELLAPDPLKTEPKEDDYLFKGAGAIIKERDPIPVCYGEVRIPARSISYEMRNEKSNITNSSSSGLSQGQQGRKGGWLWKILKKEV